jgi:ankyrin repeat protein
MGAKGLRAMQMAQDVFISYSSKDKVVADATCAVLEARGIRCWMAPRDILPGSEWGAAIVGAISTSTVMVLIYTSSSNASPQVRREVERAVARGLHVIPFRVEDVPMSPALEYFISSPHWLDAINPPMERHLDQLAKIIRAVLDAQKSSDAAAPERGAEFTTSAAGWSHGPPPGAFQPQASSISSSPSRATARNTKWVVGAGVAVVAVVGIVIGIVASQPNDKTQTAAAIPKSSEKVAPPEPSLAEPPVIAKEPEKPAAIAPTPVPPPAPTPPPVAAAAPAPKEPGEEDVKRFWELLAQGSPRILRLQEVLDDFPKLADRKNASGNTPLYEAAKAGQARVVSLLLNSAANPKEVSAGNNTPLHGLAAGGITDTQLIESLAPGNLDARDVDGNTPLHVAVGFGHADTARLLVEAGADVNLPDKSGRTPLQRAFTVDDPGKASAMVLALVAAGANCETPDKRGGTPLHFAATTGDAALLTAMIDKGAKVDRAGPGEQTALHMAVASGKIDAVKVLLAKRAAIDVVDDQGNSPLHLAATLPQTTIAEALLAAGAKVTTATKEKQTPLHVAAASGNTAMVELFMRTGGASLLAGSKPSPVEVAEKAGKKEVVALLRKLEFPAMLQSAIKSAGQPVSPKLLEMIRKDPRLAEATGADKRNLLHQCAASGNAAFAAELVKINPALVRAFSATEETPLHVAAANKQAGVVKILLAAGASMRATMRNGDTPLHVAAKAGAKDVAKLIIDAGADPAITNKAGQVAADLAADEAIRLALEQAEQEAGPIREAWADLQLENRSFDVSAPGLSAPLRIRFKDRSNFTVEGELNGAFKSLAGTYTKGSLTLAMESPDGALFPTLPGLNYTGKISGEIDDTHFGWKIGSVEISFDRP